MSDDDRVTLETDQSYGSRLGDSLKAMLMGPLLVLLAIGVLIWNEGNAVKMHRSLEEALARTTSLANINVIDPQYQNRLVHIVGKAVTDDTVHDDLLGVTPTLSKILKLQRTVEMYQWVEESHTETQKNTGGSTTTTTTYTYERQWREDLIDSSRFQDSWKHENPSFMPCSSTVFTAEPITVGAFQLPDALVNRIDWFVPYTEPVSVSDVDIKKHDLNGPIQLYDNDHSF